MVDANDDIVRTWVGVGHADSGADNGPALAYWDAMLNGADPFPIPRPSAEKGVGTVHCRVTEIDPIGRQLNRLAQESGIPARSLVVAAHLRVVASLTSKSEVLTAVAYTANADPEASGGLVPLRADLRHLTWLELGGQVLQLEEEAARHRDISFRRIMSVSPNLEVDSALTVVERDLGPEGGVPGQLDLDGFALRVRAAVYPGSDAADTAAVSVEVAYDASRVNPWTASRLVDYYIGALISIVDDPHGIAANTDLRPPNEQDAIEKWRHGPTPHAIGPDHAYAQFLEQVASQPDAPAVFAPAETLTYQELAWRVERLARRLRAQGVVAGDRVGVSIRRGADLVTGLLAVLAVEAAYVPLDPDFPVRRLEFIAQDADLGCLLLGPGAVPPLAGVPVVLGGDQGSLGVDDVTGPWQIPAAGGQDPAYVMYTSGSTGKPKGTVVEHRNVVNFFLAMDLEIGIEPGDRVLALTSVSFDISVLELLWPLARGASVVIAPERIVERITGGTDSLEGLIHRFRPRVLQATPSFFAALTSHSSVLDALVGLRVLLVGGEAFPRGLAQQLVEALPRVRVMNMYGPTETTIWSLVHLVEPGDVRTAAPPIGQPIAHTTVRVVDGLGNDALVGVSGELWISGRGVSSGYFRRPDLSRDRFVAGPDAADGTYYRTGDQVRWREDGVLEFLGRNDRQVKLRGHRIELDEVESVLSGHPGVEAAAVVVERHARRGDELVAYIRPRPEGSRAFSVGHWRDLWEATYRSDAEASGGGFTGWIDSYTRERFSDEQMRSWLDATLGRIRRLSPRRVVDIGAGGGLVMCGLHGDWDDYLAVDVSASALAAAESAAASLGTRHNVEFREGDALVLRDLPDASADLVVLNSVIQYFPNGYYLTEVLDEAVRVVGQRGAVFVGDVRDVRLLPLFHASVQLHRSPSLKAAVEIAATVEDLVRSENELCVAPAYFDSFVARHRGFVARIECKGESALTEMSRFRWDASILGPKHPATIVEAQPGPTMPWQPSRKPGLPILAALADRAAHEGGLRITDVPNLRLVLPEAMLQAMADAAPGATAWDIRRTVWPVSVDGGVDPADAMALAHERGLDARVEPARSGRRGCLDITLRRVP